MRNYINIFKAGLFSLCLIMSSGFAFADKGKDKTCFAQLSSYTAQLPGLNSVLVTLENTNSISGLRVEEDKAIVIQELGTYYIAVTGQVGVQGLGLLGNLRLWINKNGEIIPYTIMSQVVENSVSYHGLSLQTVLPLKKGDKITFGISADTTSIGLVGETNVSPSIMVTIFKL